MPGLCLGCADFVMYQEYTRRLELPLWIVAWDRYMLAAQAVDHQLQFRESLLHKEVVIEIACSAQSGGRTDLVGFLHDEFARLSALVQCALGMRCVCWISVYEQVEGLVGQARM